MDFAFTDRCQEFQQRLTASMDEHVYPAEAVYLAQPPPGPAGAFARRAWPANHSTGPRNPRTPSAIPAMS